MLAEDQQDLSDRFARKGHDRFDGAGVGARARPACRCFRACWRRSSAPSTSDRAVGDHDIFVGEMVHARSL